MSTNTLGLAYAADSGAVSQYTDLPFTSFVTVGGQLYGTTPDGLFLIGGDTDDGADIAWQAHGPMTDGGSVDHKRVRQATVFGANVENVALAIAYDSGETPSISVQRPGGRFPVGRDGSGRAVQFQLSGTGPVNITGVTLDVLSLGRRGRG